MNRASSKTSLNRVVRGALRVCALALTALAGVPPCAGAESSYPLSPTRRLVRDIADDSALRVRLAADWLTETPSRVMARRAAVMTLPSGERVQARVSRSANEFTVTLAREITGSFPGYARGTWALTRRIRDGLPVRLRVYPRSDPFAFIEFRPSEEADKTLLDVIVYDAYIERALPVPYSMKRLITAPVTSVLETTSFPWGYFEPETESYRDSVNFIDALRSRLAQVRYADDGAIDENGEYVYIGSLEKQEGSGGLNCSGFVKWVADGILRPLTGTRLAIEPLKKPYGERGSAISAVWDSLRDPFFGLDWTRNLAAAVNSAFKSASFAVLDEIEVRECPFTQVRAHTSTVNSPVVSVRTYPGYLPNAGFEMNGLQPLLYALAISEPGKVYLAAVSDERGAASPVRLFFHTALLVPYFDERGTFHILCFESAKETQFYEFRDRYEGHLVNLVRLPIEGRFEP